MAKSVLTLLIKSMSTVEPPIRDPQRYREDLSTRTLVAAPCFNTSEIGTTSLQGTKLLAPKCPLFGGFTVMTEEVRGKLEQ